MMEQEAETEQKRNVRKLVSCLRRGLWFIRIHESPCLGLRNDNTRMQLNPASVGAEHLLPARRCASESLSLSFGAKSTMEEMGVGT